MAVNALCFFLVVPWVNLSSHLHVERAQVALFCACCCVVVSVQCFFLMIYGLVCAHISLWKELVALFKLCTCLLAVLWLFRGLVCAHISHGKRAGCFVLIVFLIVFLRSKVVHFCGSFLLFAFRVCH